MHEAALAAPLLRLVLEEAGRHAKAHAQDLAVTVVTVKAGVLTGIEAPTLAGIFALMAEGTPAEGAKLVVETHAMHGSCPDCGAVDFTTLSKNFRCPQCGGEHADWTGGNELFIDSIHVAARTQNGE